MIRIQPQVRKIFYSYHWPGNVRELENLIKRFVLNGNDAVFREYLSWRKRLFMNKILGR